MSECIMCKGEDCDSTDDFDELCEECYSMVTWPKEFLIEEVRDDRNNDM